LQWRFSFNIQNVRPGGTGRAFLIKFIEKSTLKQAAGLFLRVQITRAVRMATCFTSFGQACAGHAQWTAIRSNQLRAAVAAAHWRRVVNIERSIPFVNVSESPFE
jgi:hypothetical protein